MGCGGSKTEVTESRDKQEKPKEKGDDFKDYEISTLNLHNTLRSKHGAPDMTLNRDLCDMAQKYAKFLLKYDLFEHGSRSEREWNGGSTGENIGYCMGHGFDTYDGHFTQVVWKKSIILGVGIAKSPDTRKTMMVTRYHPAGNVIGKYEENVSRPS